MQATLYNKQHPEYGEVTIPFPIPDKEYEHCIELLEVLEIGDVAKQDCCMKQFTDTCPVWKMLVGTEANIDELDYLAKYTENFFGDEEIQFLAMAHVLQPDNIRTLIDLNFSYRQVTVITDFDRLEEVGRSHYLNIHGGCAPSSEMERINGEEIALDLIAGGKGVVTPYGVLYDNGMKLEQLYCGQVFPAYDYAEKVVDVEVGVGENLTFLQLPMPELQMERMLLRGQVQDSDKLSVCERLCSKEIADVFFEQCKTADTLYELNRVCRTIFSPDNEEREKLNAVVQFMQPESVQQIGHLAEILELFDFYPKIRSPTEFGRYMIQESGHFEYDENLEGYYDFEKYGNERLAKEEGAFTDYGYVSYQGTLPLEMWMAEEEQEQGPGMGGR